MDVLLSQQASDQLKALEIQPGQKVRSKAVKKCIGILAQNPRHPGLSTHKWKGETCPHNGEMFEAYAQNNTPGAYRVFFCYHGPGGGIFIVAITPHP